MAFDDDIAVEAAIVPKFVRVRTEREICNEISILIENLDNVALASNRVDDITRELNDNGCMSQRCRRRRGRYVLARYNAHRVGIFADGFPRRRWQNDRRICEQVVGALSTMA